jgi:ketosteroid isomerase-like protein
MPRLPTLLFLTALLACGLADGVFAQAPGYRGPSARQLQAEYRAEVIGKVNDALLAWSASWSGDNLEELADLYREDATVIEDGGVPIRGPDAIREWLAAHLATDGYAQLHLQDFDARGGMAMAHSTFRINAADESTADTGNVITVFIQDGSRWRIRSQLFMRD